MQLYKLRLNLIFVNPTFAIRGPTWSLRFYFSISQNRGLQVVSDPPRFSSIENPDLDDENDDDDERFVVNCARSYARICIYLKCLTRDTRVCVRSATVINHLQTAVVQCVSRHQNLVARERAIVATHVVSQALCRDPTDVSKSKAEPFQNKLAVPMYDVALAI